MIFVSSLLRKCREYAPYFLVNYDFELTFFLRDGTIRPMSVLASGQPEKNPGRLSSVSGIKRAMGEWGLAVFTHPRLVVKRVFFAHLRERGVKKRKETACTRNSERF